MLRWLVKRGGSDLEAIHAIGLDAAEEDYLALLPAAGCFFASLAFPGSAPLAALGDFSTLVRRAPPAACLTTTTRSCSAMSTPTVDGSSCPRTPRLPAGAKRLQARFPDAIMILCIREPLRAVSSQVSSLQPARSFFGTDPEGEELPRLFRHYYERWFTDLELFARHHQALVIDQEWMARHSDRVLDQIYVRLGRDGRKTSARRPQPLRRPTATIPAAITCSVNPWTPLSGRPMPP
jgi:hypothetical protein